MFRGWRNFKDPAEALGAVGGVGMAIFFGILIFNPDDPPFWFLTPAFVLMTVGVFGEMIWKYRRRRRTPATQDHA